MSAETKAPDMVDELVRQLPPHLRENFEKADRKIQELHGLSPGVSALVRLWLACGTSSQIRREFEQALLDLGRPGVNPDELEDLDDDDL